MRAVLDQARQIAALDETPPVLITGETGTGKGLVARTIHAASPRAAQPFIEVNCTALPATLMEAELFGHERGAFTDAKESKHGPVRGGGGRLPLPRRGGRHRAVAAGQAAPAIEERTVRRVGGIRDRKIDVRILAATNRDLERESQRERFRRDLYFRLAVILLRLPPLRERGEDVLILAEHFLRRFSAKYGKQVERLEPPARERLLGLSLARQRAGAEPRDRARGALEPRARARRRAPRARGAGRAGRSPTGLAAIRHAPALHAAGRRMDLEQWERTLIEQALREADGNQTRAAQRLGISRDTLRYRLKKFGIQGSRWVISPDRWVISPTQPFDPAPTRRPPTAI